MATKVLTLYSASTRFSAVGKPDTDPQFQSVDSVKKHSRFADNHLGRSSGMIVGEVQVALERDPFCVTPSYFVDARRRYGQSAVVQSSCAAPLFRVAL
ncbi:hypothetical protein [Paraburkholderia caribensis]|uniref:hypothetical protein n=1 Tax=Paraburkholderia caribensis TaxID=75105 RepID=UPI000CD24679|nr:hypothetical protein [Paraburkholderia caribensis]AUT58017.1 hypothetical protein C2L66_39915 [Paraburkholderia caribensis]